MTDRIIDISENPARLSVSLERLVIARQGAEPTTVPFEDVGTLILGHPQILCSQPALAAVVEHGGTVVICDARRRPVGLMLPLEGHSTQGQRVAAQAAAPAPMLKRLWQAIVRAKLTSQAAVLTRTVGEDAGIALLAPRVKSGDTSNLEAQASQRYWPRLFEDAAFRRRREREDQNALLNYGYAVLRAAVARMICASGLHPSLGLHHHNKYNSFCLADDLMEPYRPLVDERVVSLVRARAGDALVLDREAKSLLVQTITDRYVADGAERTFLDHLTRYVANVARVFTREEQRLSIPPLWHVPAGS